MIVKKIITELKDLEITGATLLSAEEYEKYKIKISSRKDYWWWLRSSGLSESCAHYVNYCGYVSSRGDYVDNNYTAVVPALKIILNSDFEIGDKIKFGDQTFTIISDNYALCDDNIGYHCFREDWEESDSNDYEKSDIKKFIDDWFERSKKRNDNKSEEKGYM